MRHAPAPSSVVLAVVSSFGALFPALHAQAASLTWDGNGATAPNPDGGTGTWDTTTANWWNGAANVTWPTTGTDNDAVFANTAGTVTLAAGGVTANDLAFNTTGYTVSGATLTLNGTTPTVTTGSGVSTTVGSVIAGSVGLTKAGTGILTLTGASTYTGATRINNGTLVIGANNALATTNTVQMNSAGSGTTPATFDLSNFSQTLGGFQVLNTNTTNADTVLIGAGQTLTVNGAVTIGHTGSASINTTLANVTGAGAFVVNNSGGTFQVGGASSATLGNKATLDMSGLASFTVNLGTTGTFRVGDTSLLSAAGGESTVLLADTSAITAGTLDVGATSGHFTTVNSLKLGAIQNTLNVNTVAIGTTTSARSNGEISFRTGTGTVTLRAADGTGRASLQVANVTNVTGVGITGAFDTTGHSADLLVSTLSVGVRNLAAATATGGSIGAFSFDTGTLDVTTVTLGLRNNVNSANNVDATMNLGGGTVTIGTLNNMGQNTNSVGTGSSAATLNITAGTVAIGSLANMAVNGGSNGTVTSTLNFTGGTITLAGNITRNAASGSNATAILNLNGSTLDMGGFAIGGAGGAALTSVNLQSGTLRNVSQINNGAAVVKNTAGTLTLEGTNTYTGSTTVNAGTLLVDGTHTAGAGAYSVGATGKIGGTGTITTTGAFTAAGEITGGDFGSVGTLNIAGAGSRTLGGTAIFDVDYGAMTSDTLNITGATSVDLAGATFEIDAIAGSLPAAGSHYALKLFSSDVAVTGTPAGQSNYGGTVLGLAADQSIVTWDGGMTYYLVPEPASFALLGLGSLLLLARPGRRRRVVSA